MSRYNPNKPSFISQDDNLFLEYYLHNPVILWRQGILLVKDSSHRFIASNNNFKLFSGFSAKALIGLSDSDMPWGDSQDLYINHEKDVLSGNVYSVIEPLNGLSKVNLFTQKDIIYHQNGSPGGTMATAAIFNHHLEYGNLEGTSRSLKVSNFSEYNLTATESKVLYFILKGFKRARVAELAEISTSSFDFHIKNIKVKFSVDTFEALIDVCYQNRIHDLFPVHIISPHL
ncbi:helix-turn-helix transcriptional regulator [Dryocola sp. LX212]|jgi:DNA-binding CsgD family transcriptional regulator